MIETHPISIPSHMHIIINNTIHPSMFTEFLHPELVLFGNFLDPKQGCKHHIESKDG
jgi:hypothetical protein